MWVGGMVYPRRESATPDNTIINERAAIAMKDPIKEPEIRSQKELNCWQMANQFALVFPLCAKYTIAAAAEPAAVNRARVTCMGVELYYRIEYNQDDSAVPCFAPHDVEDGQS